MSGRGGPKLPYTRTKDPKVDNTLCLYVRYDGTTRKSWKTSMGEVDLLWRIPGVVPEEQFSARMNDAPTS